MAQFQFTITSSEVSNINSLLGVTSKVITADRGLSRSSQQRVLVASFGDGYEQRIGDGINVKQDSFSISFNNRSAAEANVIAAFFDNRAGKAFTFTVTDSAGNTNLKVVCDTYNTTYVRENIHSISATFRRVYEP